MYISTENLDVKESLERMKIAVLKHGGYIHPEMTIHQALDQIWVSCKKTVENETLLNIPIDLFIPVTQLQWQFSKNTLSYSDKTNSLTAPQQELLADIVHIYNSTNKVATHQNSSMCYLLKKNKSLLAWFSSSWTDYGLPESNSTLDFLATRWIRLIKNSKPHDDVKYLMPFIDFINHHPNGPKIQHDGSQRKLAIFQPNEHSDECNWCYNGADSLSLAYQHGYLETNTCSR